MPGQVINGVQIFQRTIGGENVVGPVFPHKAIRFFQEALSKTHGTASTPGTASASAMAQYGAIGLPYNATLTASHIHQTLDGSGTNTVEIYRRRAGVMTMIASGSLLLGGGDFALMPLTITDGDLLQDDYIYMQATSIGQGGTPYGTVDCHLTYTGEA